MEKEKIKAEELRKLISNYENKKSQYETAIAAIENLISNIVGEEIESNDFAGDGLGIRLVNDISGRVETYVGVETLLDIIKEKGSLTAQDLVDNKSL